MSSADATIRIGNESKRLDVTKREIDTNRFGGFNCQYGITDQQLLPRLTTRLVTRPSEDEASSSTACLLIEGMVTSLADDNYIKCIVLERQSTLTEALICTGKPVTVTAYGNI